MSTNGRTLATRLGCAATLILATHAQAETAELRCWYNQPNEATDISTGYKVAGDIKLEGYWANLSSTPGANLFYTTQSHKELRKACDSAVHLPKSIRDRVPFVERNILSWTAQASKRSFNHQIWHVGDQAPGKPIERIVAFGDSLSDNGNMYNYSQWILPHGKAWAVGRFTNGPVWVEYLARSMDVPLNNWAIGGSASDTAKGLIAGIGQQVTSFIRHAAKDSTYDPSRTLFTFLTGANDFMNDEDGKSSKVVLDVLRRQEKALSELASLGATKILLLNLPDISKTPAFKEKSELKALLIRDKVRFYNEGLPHIAARVSEATGADIRVFDLGAKFDELVAAPSLYGMFVSSTPCLDLPSGLFIDYVDHVKATPWCLPDEWVFWDGVHPTTRAHELLAGWVLRTVQDAWSEGDRP